jgi:hypothetical protein
VHPGAETPVVEPAAAEGADPIEDARLAPRRVAIEPVLEQGRDA